MKYKVIFDTNSIRNAESAADFLGGRADLERFSKVSEIIIPDLVIEEIKRQKKRSLGAKRDSFLSNPFHLLRNIDINDTKSFDIDKWILELESKEKINFKTISLTQDGILEKMKNLCLSCLPPFEKYSDNKSSDKGFKDSYIYFTILEYLVSSKDKNIFVVTKDERFKEAFFKEERIKVINGYDEFEGYIDDYFRKPYFVSRLKEEVDAEIEKSDIENTWLNLEENWILKIVSNSRIYFVEVDFASKEIINFVDFDYSQSISRLITLRSFAVTHEVIELLKDYVKFLSDEDIQALIKAGTENDQIYHIAGDEEVREFFLKLYQAKSQIVSEEIREVFQRYFEIK